MEVEFKLVLGIKARNVYVYEFTWWATRSPPPKKERRASFPAGNASVLASSAQQLSLENPTLQSFTAPSCAMAEGSTTVPVVRQTSAECRRGSSPLTQLRHRHYHDPLKSSGTSPVLRGSRRAVSFSDTLCEARQSIKSSTDDFIRPRASVETDGSYWQSAPLALALVPAIGGIFFQNGSAVLTDVTLICLAGVFLNWSVRLPWDWYHAAQESTRRPPPDEVFDSEDRPNGEASRSDQETALAKDTQTDDSQKQPHGAGMGSKASRELHFHEMIALASCFIFPAFGTLLLHAIRSKLSRPSEGLISNYNLTIFLLAAEIRPLSHLLKLVQARTLHLRRAVESTSPNPDMMDATKIVDISRRLDELEAQVEELLTHKGEDQTAQESSSELEQKLCEIEAQVRKAMQVDIAALNRAVRKYEKRLTTSALDTDTRFDNIESQIRNIMFKKSPSPKSQGNLLLRWIRVLAKSIQPILLLPWHVLRRIVMLPISVTAWWFSILTRVLGWGGYPENANAKDSIRLKRIRRQNWH
nr:hypothetical protein CPAG_03512 [Coccidioides posadasii RMSCC 3488]